MKCISGKCFSFTDLCNDPGEESDQGAQICSGDLLFFEFLIQTGIIDHPDTIPGERISWAAENLCGRKAFGLSCPQTTYLHEDDCRFLETCRALHSVRPLLAPGQNNPLLLQSSRGAYAFRSQISWEAASFLSACIFR